jgi:hypothetical protein
LQASQASLASFSKSKQSTEENRHIEVNSALFLLKKQENGFLSNGASN